MPQKLNREIVAAAIAGFEQQKQRIDAQIAELKALFPSDSVELAETAQPFATKRKKRSAASRRKMALAQKARWAKIKGQSEPSLRATPEAPKPKRKLSAAGRKAIIAAAKRRWALQRADAAKTQTAATKKAAGRKATVKAPQQAAKRSEPAKRPAVKKAATEAAAQ